MKLRLGISTAVMGLCISLLATGKADAASFDFTKIADFTGSFKDVFFPSINDKGTVAFAARLDEGGSGIFTGADPLKDKVIATGDQLLDSTVENVGFWRERLNNSGQIAFWARLANGITGIFRADPQFTQPESVPEPTHTLGILAFAALAAVSIWKHIPSSN